MVQNITSATNHTQAFYKIIKGAKEVHVHKVTGQVVPTATKEQSKVLTESKIYKITSNGQKAIFDTYTGKVLPYIKSLFTKEL